MDKRLRETPTIGSRISERRPSAAEAGGGSGGAAASPPRISPPTAPPLAPPPLAPPPAPPQPPQTAAAAAAGATKPTASRRCHRACHRVGCSQGRWMGSGATAGLRQPRLRCKAGAAAAAARLGSAASWTVAPEAPSAARAWVVVVLEVLFAKGKVTAQP